MSNSSASMRSRLRRAATGPCAVLTAVLVATVGLVPVAAAGTSTPAPATPAIAAAVAIPRITVQPAPISSTAGRTVRFSVTATGEGLTYQWQEELKGKVFVDVPGARKSYHNVATTPGRDGARYRVLVRNAGGTAISRAVKLAVSTPIARISTQPKATRASAGQTVTFTSAATGYGISYQWQEEIRGGVFKNVTNATKSYHRTVATPGRDGARYRVLVRNAGGTAISQAVKLTVVTAAPKITAQPAKVTIVRAGTKVTFSAAASGYGLSYQWQQELPGDVFRNYTNATRTIHSVVARTAINGARYRLVVRNAGGVTYSAPATLYVQSTREDPERANTVVGMTTWKVLVSTSNTDALASIRRDIPDAPSPRPGYR
ncbi:hypothetical protein GIS00_22615 [Nakamurella sp. YIM 132087]|uniref:Immunoglobulin domain-containing protein n=1 Tax=Nakamurella alba TaxID=2665158 RepID=A0A7K1FV76_9ACTN|nr:hypothetical protein [Nakamurella alba]MTD16734.1 hypothetical protein [Nakamurella alba]